MHEIIKGSIFGITPQSNHKASLTLAICHMFFWRNWYWNTWNDNFEQDEGRCELDIYATHEFLLCFWQSTAARWWWATDFILWNISVAVAKKKHCFIEKIGNVKLLYLCEREYSILLVPRESTLHCSGQVTGTGFTWLISCQPLESFAIFLTRKEGNTLDMVLT